MTPKEAAEYIGCSVFQVRWLIRNEKLPATKLKSKNNQWGYEYKIHKLEAKRIRDNKKMGAPRGPRPFPFTRKKKDAET